MKIKQTIIRIWNNPLDVWYYVQGNIRYILWYSNFKFLIRKHIRLQIAIRIKSMNRECHISGACIKCGCKTTHLQMCNKACDGDCYPKMLSKKDLDFTMKTTYTPKYDFAMRDGKFKKIF